MEGQLICLVSDLLQREVGRGLRRVFNVAPEAIMDLYRLSADKRRCFYRMEAHHIADELAAEVQRWEDARHLPDIPEGGEGEGALLMHLVADLMQFPYLMEVLERQTSRVLRFYGLAETERTVLRTKDPVEIAEHVLGEGQGMTYPDTDGQDFPDDEDPDRLLDDDEVGILYPTVGGKVWRFGPRRIFANTPDVGLTILARSVPRWDNCAVRLEPEGEGPATRARDVDVTGTFRKSRIRCRFDAPTETGPYRVVVVSCPSTRHEYEFAGQDRLEVV